jgi:hypothetical protein
MHFSLATQEAITGDTPTQAIGGFDTTIDMPDDTVQKTEIIVVPA